MTPELSQAYAAAEIATEKVARLTERVRELEELVMVLAKFDQPHCYSSKNGTPIFVMNGHELTHGHARRARAALAKREG